MTGFRIHGFPRNRQDRAAYEIWDTCPHCRAMFDELDNERPFLRSPTTGQPEIFRTVDEVKSLLLQ